MSTHRPSVAPPRVLVQRDAAASSTNATKMAIGLRLRCEGQYIFIKRLVGLGSISTARTTTATTSPFTRSGRLFHTIDPSAATSTAITARQLNCVYGPL